MEINNHHIKVDYEQSKEKKNAKKNRPEKRMALEGRNLKEWWSYEQEGSWLYNQTKEPIYRKPFYRKQ